MEGLAMYWVVASIFRGPGVEDLQRERRHDGDIPYWLFTLVQYQRAAVKMRDMSQMNAQVWKTFGDEIGKVEHGLVGFSPWSNTGSQR